MVVTEYLLQLFLSFGITTVSGVVDISCSSSRQYLGDPITCTCTTDSAIGIDWQSAGSSFLLCFSASGTCGTVPPEYEVSNDVSGSSKIFRITIKSFSYSDCGNFTCKDQAGSDTDMESLLLYGFDPNVPASLTENIVSGSGKIEITTDCLYRKDEIKATWFTISEGNENEYIPDSSYSTPSSCASDVCGAETAYTLNIGFNYKEATKNPLKVKFKLKVYHEFNSSLQLELTTADDYYIESTPGPKCWCLCQEEGWKCFVCWLICFLVIEFIVGCMIGGCLICRPEALKGCLECKSSDCPECCSKFCKCCDNNIVRCKCCGSCCDIGGVPFWYYILLWTFIGTPVAFGIFIVMKCRKRGARYVVRNVVVEHDDNGLLGFNHGSVIVTSVTPGGPADNKLKVGEHVRKIDNHPTEGKTLGEIQGMLESKQSLTLTVSKVGSDDTRHAVIQGQPLGFVVDIRTMIAKVQAGGPADGKLKVGERVLSINGKSTESKTNSEINEWLKPTSNFIKLSVQKGGREENVQLHYDDKASLGIEKLEIDKNQSQHIMVSAVKKDSTADKKEIQEGDIILKVNGENTKSMTIAEVRKKMKSSVEFKATKDVTLLELDPDRGSIGLEMCPASMVTSVTPGGRAATAGIKPGQRILSINGKDTDGMSQDEMWKVLHSSMKSVTLKLGEGSSPDAKHTATSKSHPKKNIKSSKEKPADQLPLPEISHADGAYGGGKDRIEIENESVSYSKPSLPSTGRDVPGHDFHKKLPDIQKV